MNIIYYLLQTIVCSSILYAYYWLALRDKPHHTYNRVYLLLILALSLIFPLLKVDLLLDSFWNERVVTLLTNTPSSNIIISANATSKVDTGWGLTQVLLALYISVSAIFCIRFFSSIYKIGKQISEGEKLIWNNVRLIKTDASGVPFSFLNYIFWSPVLPLNDDGERILSHELVHVRQGHTHDKLLANFLLCLFWMNPIFWLVKKELSIVHEFIADEKSTDNDPAILASMLLQCSFPGSTYLPIANYFIKSPIKRRLLMITKNAQRKLDIVARSLAIPALLLAASVATLRFPQEVKAEQLLSPATKVQAPDIRAQSKQNQIPEETVDKQLPKTDGKENESKTSTETNSIALSSSELTDTVPKIKMVSPSTAIDTQQTDGNNIVFEKMEKEASFPGGEQGFRQFLQANLNANTPVDNGAPDGLYTVMLQFIVSKKGKVTDIKALTSHGFGMEEQCIGMIKKSPDWIPAMQNGKKVNAYRQQPISFQVASK